MSTPHHLDPAGEPWPTTPNGTPHMTGSHPLHWIDDWTQSLAATLDQSFRPHDDTGALITPESIGAATIGHTHHLSEVVGFMIGRVDVELANQSVTQVNIQLPAGRFTDADRMVAIGNATNYQTPYLVRTYVSTPTLITIGVRHVAGTAATTTVPVSYIVVQA